MQAYLFARIISVRNYVCVRSDSFMTFICKGDFMKFKKVLSVLCVASAFLLNACPIFANDAEPTQDTAVDPVWISDETEQIYWSDEYQETLRNKVEKLQEQSAPKLTRAGDVVLNTPRYTQENGYYCLPASVQIVVKYTKGILYSQTDLANTMGTVTGVGTDFGNALVPVRNLTGLDYEIGNTNQYNFYNNMDADINGNCPVIYFVNEASLHDNGTNIGHTVVGNGYGNNATVWFWDVDPAFGYTNWYCSSSEMNSALQAEGGYYIF